MRFLEALRAHLRGVERSDAPMAEDADPPIDLPTARQHALEALERAERVGPGASPPWVSRSSLDDFLQAVAWELRQALCATSDRAELQRHVRLVVELALSLPVETISAVRARELRRVARAAREAALGGDHPRDLLRYSTENRLLRRQQAGVALSPLGRVLLRLSSEDAVQWLLAIEGNLSLGPRDDWHTDRSVLRALLRAGAGFHVAEILQEADAASGEEDGREWLSMRSLFRLEGLGVLQPWESTGFRLTPRLRPMLEGAASGQRSPLAVLADTLLAEERGAALQHVVDVTVPADDTALVALERHSRMVAHELHNAIVPVRHALRKLYEGLAQHAPADAWQTYQQRIDRNVDRVLRFADQMAAASTLAATPSEPFDPVVALRDAIAELNGGLAERVQVVADGAVPLVRGHRHRFVMATVNLLRNATQSAPERPVRVRVDLAASSDRVRIAVSDDGPAVPERYREAIFQPGFTLREGGQGQGLALVRDVVEREMGGTVRYEASDLGGAAFVVTVPAAPRREP